MPNQPVVTCPSKRNICQVESVHRIAENRNCAIGAHGSQKSEHTGGNPPLLGGQWAPTSCQVALWVRFHLHCNTGRLEMLLAVTCLPNEVCKGNSTGAYLPVQPPGKLRKCGTQQMQSRSHTCPSVLFGGVYTLTCLSGSSWKTSRCCLVGVPEILSPLSAE